MTDNRNNWETGEEAGWNWFEPPVASPETAEDPDLAKAFARCFRGRDGERALAHLRAITLERAMGPGVSDAMLRHAEGQRQLYAYMAALVARGRGLPSSQ